ncbi:MAG: RNA polymerase subunit sigma, partial [Hymenobacter sp.]|nr:RNA polymerase subunit sigma [Hymenobacter sp.]
MTPADKALKELFQAEFTKMVAVIGRYFGLQHLEAAEDVVGETFLLATQTWTTTGPPPNPAAWLYAVAKQKSLLLLRREKLYEQKILPELAARQDWQQASFELSFSPQSIRDSQLQMLFAICTPAIASEAQMGLALRILCGFGIEEIAEAFFSTKEAINKRLFRAREKLRAANISLELPDDANIARRLDSVLHVLYLLFSEGYYSKTQNQILRQDLCREALRLGLLLTEYAPTTQPKTNALLALMCFHASRFGARLA